MSYDTLQIFVPAFAIVFFLTVALWSHVRKSKRIRYSSAEGRALTTEMRLLDFFFKILLLMSVLLAITYAFFPEYYYLAGPIEWLDNPVINTIGVLVLKISLIWIVMAQFNIEKTIAMINSGIEESSLGKLLTYSQKLILTGMLIMFFGLFITISSVLGILICFAAAIMFDRVQRIV